MELIVTEKDNAARRIADILSDGAAGRNRRRGVPVYAWDDTRCIGLSGHVVGVDFPPEYEGWRDVEPVELADAPVVKTPTKEDIVGVLQELATEADRAIIATDYDREGELIGKEAYELIADATHAPVDRVRFSSITEREVRDAFENPDQLDFDLAAAGEARQVIDLVWGAALTRFLSLSSGQLGDDFLSVGRVQSPTLKFIVDRERDIRAFEPEDYWELFADLSKGEDAFEAQYFDREDGAERERIDEETEAERIHERLSDASVATVVEVRRRTRTDDPPAPFDTTAFIGAAGSLGYGAQRAMSIAEDLYTAGYVTYPRTDNTVYPDDLAPEELLATFADSGAFGDDAARVLDARSGGVEPTRGDTESTDHPPIHPTGEIPGRDALSDDEWEIYELIVRRFLATCSEPARWEHLRITAEANGCSLKANGKRLLESGYLAVYPYASSDETHLPDLREGEELAVTDARIEAKQTRPPRRRGQSRLIEMMADKGVGTKCITGDTSVLVRTATGDVERRNASELFESRRTVLADGDTDIAATDGPETLSYDETSERTRSVEADLVSRRELGSDEQVLSVTTDAGTVSVTGDHPMYVVRDGRTTVVPARAVDVGDQLLSTRNAPFESDGTGPVLTSWGGFANPFPLEWSDTLARVLGNLLGDGAIHRNEAENVVDVRYHNTDQRLVDRFAADIETLFDIDPTITERAGRENHHPRKYRVNLPSAPGRTLATVLDEATTDGRPTVPEPYRPAFVGALFDDEGHISRERKAFISNTDHELLAAVGEILDDIGIETKLARDQHKLHIRGRENLERFLDEIPISADEEFYRGLDGLRTYDMTRDKARILEAVTETPRASDELAATVGLSRGRVNDHLRRLRAEGYLQKRVEGSNRGDGGDRIIRYEAIGFRDSIYATVLGYPSVATVRSVSERSYDGPVFDLSVAEDAPNFAVEGGIVVHNSTRHDTLQKLYDRGYVTDDPPRPTTLAMAVVEAAEEFADRVVDEEMTRQLEADMTAIANGEKRLEEVTEESREMLRCTFEDLRENREAIGEYLRESLKADKQLGPCPECGEQLLVRRSRQGSYFIGCDGFPDCEYTLPLPSQGEPTLVDERCEEHDLAHVKMLAGRSTFVHGCPRCRTDEADETADRVLGSCPECGAEHGGELAVKQLRSGSRLVGCIRYPDCDYSLPLPRRGEIEIREDERCEEHDLPALAVLDGDEDDDPWELGCPICNYETYREQQRASELEDLDGLGTKTADKLADAGIDDLGDLRAADAESVAGDVQGVSAERVREWQAQAG